MKHPNFEAKEEINQKKFFPRSISEWNKLDINICNTKFLSFFKPNLLKFICPTPNDTHSVRVNLLLTRLRPGLIYVRDHMFNHNFLKTMLPLWDCCLEIESTVCFFSYCHNHSTLNRDRFSVLLFYQYTLLILSACVCIYFYIS